MTRMHRTDLWPSSLLIAGLTEIASDLGVTFYEVRKQVVTHAIIVIYRFRVASSPGTGSQAALPPSWAQSGTASWRAAPGYRPDRPIPYGLSKWGDQVGYEPANCR